MKARPILFNGDMVRALIEGRKTQTRRIVKPQPHWVQDAVMNWAGRVGMVHAHNSPYGMPGDLLWVRESYFPLRLDWRDLEGHTPRLYAADGGVIDPHGMGGYDHAKWNGKPPMGHGFKPSIHMPRWASRLTLEITAIRVERLQDISEADAIAEGVESDTDGWRDYLMPETQCFGRAYDSFASLWHSISGADSWRQNPWVWVPEFRVHQCNVDEYLRERAA